MKHQDIDPRYISDEGISSLEIIDFFVENIVTISLCTLTGVIIGFIYFLINDSYRSSILFKNNANIDLAYYEKITKEIPLHVKQVESKNELYKKISKEIYWKENLTPIPSISKENFKYLQLDKNEKNLFISSFVITLQGNDLNKN